MLNLRIEPEEHVLRFGAFTLDVPARTLMYRSKPVALTPKEFDILAALALARGTPVTQDQLVALVWAGEATADAVLFQTVYRLRRTLIDHDGLTDYIAAVPGRGYLFTAPVLPAQPSGRGLDVGGEAFTYYSRAMFQFHQRTQQSLAQAIALFRRALYCNPQFAPAYVGIAHAHLCAGVSLFSGQRYAYHQTKRACRKALIIDPQCGDAYAILSEVHVFFENDVPAAKEALRKSLALAPQSARARTAAFWVHLQSGDTDRAISYAKQALAIDSSSNHFTTLLGVGLYYAGRYAEAHEHLVNAHLFRPADSMAMFYDAAVLYFLDDFCGALERLDLIEGGERDPRVAALRACIAVAQGRLYWAHALMQRLQLDATQPGCYLFSVDPLFRRLRDCYNIASEKS